MVKHISKIAHGSDVYYIKDTEARSALIDKTEKGAANGVATLDSGGKVPSSQLPSYVDDVIEGYYHTNKFYTTFIPGENEDPDTYSDEITAESGKIYVDIPTNVTYRWSGSAYVEISESLALGETSSTAYAGNKGKAIKDAFELHEADTDIHITAQERTAWNAKVNSSSVGLANGVASLGDDGKVPSSQLPSSSGSGTVEGYYHDGAFYTTYTPGEGGESDTYSDLITPDTTIFYLDIPTNNLYRWGGSSYSQFLGTWRPITDSYSGSDQTISLSQYGANALYNALVNGYASSAGNADTTDGLHVHGGRNNEANKIVRTDGNGYIQCGYINSSSGNEGNNASPARVWGTNGSDDYLRTYLTSALSVGYASSAGQASQSAHLLINGATWDSNWHWSGQGGLPTWLWGSNDGINHYVWNPSNFSVNYANSAGYASSAGSANDGRITVTRGTCSLASNSGLYLAYVPCSWDIASRSICFITIHNTAGWTVSYGNWTDTSNAYNVPNAFYRGLADTTAYYALITIN